MKTIKLISSLFTISTVPLFLSGCSTNSINSYKIEFKEQSIIPTIAPIEWDKSTHPNGYELSEVNRLYFNAIKNNPKIFYDDIIYFWNSSVDPLESNLNMWIEGSAEIEYSNFSIDSISDDGGLLSLDMYIKLNMNVTISKIEVFAQFDQLHVHFEKLPCMVQLFEEGQEGRGSYWSFLTIFDEEVNDFGPYGSINGTGCCVLTHNQQVYVYDGSEIKIDNETFNKDENFLLMCVAETFVTCRTVFHLSNLPIHIHEE